MKRIFTFLVAFILLINFPIVSLANTIDALQNIGIGTTLQPDDSTNSTPSVISDQSGDQTSKPGGIAGMIFDAIVDILTMILSNVLILILNILPSIDDIIFNKTQTVNGTTVSKSPFTLSFFDATPSGFAGDIQGICSALYNSFRYLVTATYIVILIYLAIRILLSTVGKQKARYKELLKYWITGLLLLFCFHWVMAYIIWLSNQLTAVFSSTAVAALGSKTLNEMMVGSIKDADGGTNGWASLLNPLISPILYIVLIWYTLTICFLYIKRLFTVALLIVLFPLMALSYVFDKIGDRKSQSLQRWIKEFSVNVLIQPIHAMLLSFVVLIYTSSSSSSVFRIPFLGPILAILLLIILPKGEALIKNLFQISSSMGAGSTGIAGANVAHQAMALKQVKDRAKDFKNSIYNKDLMKTRKDLKEKYGNPKDLDSVRRKEYEEELKKRTGSSKSMGAQLAINAMKAPGMLTGATAGAIIGMSTNNPKDTLAYALSGSRVGGAFSAGALNKAVGAKDGIKGMKENSATKKSNLERFNNAISEAISSDGKVNLDNISDTSFKERLKKALPNGGKGITADDLGKIRDTYNQRKRYAGSDVSIENSVANSEFARNARLLDEHINPETGKPMTTADLADYEIFHGKGGTTYRSKKDGRLFSSANNPNKDASDQAIFLPADGSNNLRGKDGNPTTASALINDTIASQMEKITGSSNPKDWDGYQDQFKEVRKKVTGQFAHELSATGSKMAMPSKNIMTVDDIEHGTQSRMVAEGLDPLDLTGNTPLDRTQYDVSSNKEGTTYRHKTSGKTYTTGQNAVGKGSMSNVYLPADGSIPPQEELVENINNAIEAEMVRTTGTSDHAKWASNSDFKRSFSKARASVITQYTEQTAQISTDTNTTPAPLPDGIMTMDQIAEETTYVPEHAKKEYVGKHTATAQKNNERHSTSSSTAPTPDPTPDTASSPFDVPDENPDRMRNFSAESAGSYVAPATPAGSYSAPATSTDSYSVPATPSGSYSAPATPTGSYSAPATPSGSYSAPATPTGSYSAPTGSSGSGSSPVDYGPSSPTAPTSQPTPSSSTVTGVGYKCGDMLIILDESGERFIEARRDQADDGMYKILIKDNDLDNSPVAGITEEDLAKLANFAVTHSEVKEFLSKCGRP